MHGSAQGQDDVADFGVDAGFLSSFHVGGDGSDGGAGAEGHGSGLKQVLPHDLGAALAAAEAGIDGEEHKHVDEAQGVVNDQGAAVVADQLRAVGGDQVGEEAEEADGGIVGDDLDSLEDAAGDVLQQLGSHGLGAAVHLHAEAADHSEHDHGQDGTAAQQLHEVRLGEEVDDHIAQADDLGDVCLRGSIVAGDHGEHPHNGVHDHSGDTGGDAEGSQSHTHDLTSPLCTGHIGNGRSNGAEHHGHHRAEHQVGEDRAEGFQCRRGLGEHQSHNAAACHADKHAQQESVVLEELFHTFYSLSKL